MTSEQVARMRKAKLVTDDDEGSTHLVHDGHICVLCGAVVETPKEERA